MRFKACLSPVAVLAALLPLLITGTVSAQQPGAEPDPSTLRRMYGDGVDFDSFRARAVSRKQLWEANWEKSAPAAELIARARALSGRYRLLVVAIDSCSDSANTIPYIARLVEQVDTLDMQIIDPQAGRVIMNTYRTPDDRGATPTVVILDEEFEAAGVWVERPSALQDWWIGHPEISDREKGRRKQGWYDWDEGYSTHAEIIALLEAADARR